MMLQAIYWYAGEFTFTKYWAARNAIIGQIWKLVSFLLINKEIHSWSILFIHIKATATHSNWRAAKVCPLFSSGSSASF